MTKVRHRDSTMDNVNTNGKSMDMTTRQAVDNGAANNGQGCGTLPFNALASCFKTFYMQRVKLPKAAAMLRTVAVCLTVMLLAACSVSYKFNGASIDYTKTKTIQIADFPIRSSYVWGPMASIFNNKLKDLYADNTRLVQVKRNGDLKIEGEITQYNQRNKAVTSEGSSAQTELSMTVNVRFTNNVNHKEDFEKQFSATATYENTQTLSAVQEELVTQMVKTITDQIFNATVANW